MEKTTNICRECGTQFNPLYATSLDERFCSKTCHDVQLPLLTTGYPDNNPKTTFGAKKPQLHLVPPAALIEMATAFQDGADKYGPYNWREKKISSSVYYGACLRHLTAWWDGEDLAEDSGVHHLSHALACIAMILDGKELDKLNDDRPTQGPAAKLIRQLTS